MSLYNHTQLCGDPEIKFRRDGTALFCTIDESLTMEAKHIRALATALDAYEAEKAAEVAA